MGQISLINSLVLIGLFTIALLSFAIGFAHDTNAPISIANDQELTNLNSRITGNVSSFAPDSNKTYYSIVGSEVTSTDITPSGQQFSLTPLNAISVVKTILSVGYIKIFGNGSGFGIFLTTFIAILTFMIGLFIWKTWKGGSPD
jgi:hypothetical protein